MRAQLLSCIRLFAARQAPLSMGFPTQEYWSVLPFPSPGDIPDPRIEPKPVALVGRFFTAEPPEKLKGKADRIPNCTCFVYELCKNVLRKQNKNAECWQSILVSGGTWGRERWCQGTFPYKLSGDIQSKGMKTVLLGKLSSKFTNLDVLQPEECLHLLSLPNLHRPMMVPAAPL